MVRTAKWVTILPRTVARILPDELIFRPIAGLDEKRSVSMLTRERTQFPALVEEFSKILQGCVAQQYR